MLQIEVVGTCEGTCCNLEFGHLCVLMVAKDHVLFSVRLRGVASQFPTTSFCSTTQDLSFSILHDYIPVLTCLLKKRVFLAYTSS